MNKGEYINFKGLSNEEILIQVINKMKYYTEPYIGATYGLFNRDEGKLLGSGGFLKLNSNIYYLSAGHVFTEVENFDYGLALTTGTGTPSLICHYPRINLKPFDIGIVQVDNTILSNKRPASIQDLALNSNGLENDYLFLQGYPGERSKKIVFNVDNVTTLPYGTVIKDSDYKKDIYFELDYDPAGLIDEHFTQANQTNAHGLSGSLVWKCNVNGNVNWNPNMSRIVGIVHRWDDETNTLICTRIECVRDMLLEQIRQEFAYFSWIERGSPPNDDWTDWFYAFYKFKDL